MYEIGKYSHIERSHLEKKLVSDARIEGSFIERHSTHLTRLK